MPREDSAAPLLAKIADLEQQLSTATSTCQKYQTEIAALRETISQKSSAIVEPLESASKAKEEPLLALQSQVSSQTATIERQAAEIARLTAELREKCENQAGTHREQLEEFARNKADAEKQMLAALEATSALENERQGLEQQREKLHRKDIDLQTRQALLEATEAEVDLKLKAALQSEQITDELQKDLWAKQSFIKEKDDLIEQLNATIQELQSAGSPVAAREKRSKSLHAQRPSIEISESPPIEKIEEPTASETRDPFLKEEKPDRGRFLNPTLYYTKTESVSCDSEEELPSKNLILQDRMPPSNDEDLGLLELQKQLDALKKKDHEQAKLIEKFQKNQNDNNEHLKKLETDLKTHKELVRNLSCEKASIENLLYMVGLEKKNLIDKLRAEFAGIENCLEGSRRVIASLRQENDGLRQANLALFEHQRALEQFAQPGMRTEKPAESPQAANKSASDQGLNESQVLFTESLVKPKQTQAAAQNLKAPRKDSAADWLESEEEAHYDSEKKEPRGEPQQKPDVLFHHSKTQEARATQPAPFRSEIEPTSARSGKSNPKHVAPQQKHRRADNNSHARRDRDDDEYVPKRNPGADSRPSDKHRAAGRSTGSNEYERKSLDAPPAKQAEQPHQREKQLMSQSATNLKQAAVRPEEPRQSKGASQREPTSEERRAAPQGEFVFVEENFKVNSEPDFFKASKASIVEVPPASFTKQLDVGDFDSADDEDSGWISVPDKQPRHLTESCVEQQPVSAAKGKPKGPNPYMSDSLKSLSAAKPDRAPQEGAAKAVSQFGPEEPGLGKKSERSSLQPEPDTPSSRNFATKEKEEVRSNLASSQFLSQQGDDCDEESGSKKGAGSLLESRLWADALPEDNFFEETTQFDDIQDSLQKKFESVMGESKASGSQASPSKKKKKNKTAQPQN